ncbi:MAG TPA: hypothetical protein VFG45_11750 [Candidatus Nitrosocosmicus sp.]|nr:hypothetical protein [Candidatus Nitrosocosmicus sp.]
MEHSQNKNREKVHLCKINILNDTHTMTLRAATNTLAIKNTTVTTTAVI